MTKINHLTNQLINPQFILSANPSVNLPVNQKINNPTNQTNYKLGKQPIYLPTIN